VRGGEASVAAEHRCPALLSATSGVADGPVVLRASNDDAGVGIAARSVKLGDAKIVVEIGPTAAAAGGVDVVGAPEATVVTEINRADRGPIEHRVGDHDVLVGVNAARVAADIGEGRSAVRAAIHIGPADNDV